MVNDKKSEFLGQHFGSHFNGLSGAGIGNSVIQQNSQNLADSLIIAVNLGVMVFDVQVQADILLSCAFRKLLPDFEQQRVHVSLTDIHLPVSRITGSQSEHGLN